VIVPIGDWVIMQACKDAATWPKDIKVAVNLSPVQFKNQTLAHTVVRALDSSGLSPSRLELEITESVLLDADDSTVGVLHQLRSLGVRIAMDDFGTGYSSLSYLRSFPFDKIKIDRSFVHEISETGDSMAIVKAVAMLGASLGMTTTAEGIETADQLQKVREHGCVEVQGYYFSRPVPQSEVPKLLRGNIAAVA
jgi:EAL domain-containing protein (putative c-di-GMP-specific phosphodiesterase class I)